MRDVRPAGPEKGTLYDSSRFNHTLNEVCRYKRLMQEVSIWASIMRECIDSNVMEACARHTTDDMIKFKLASGKWVPLQRIIHPDSGTAIATYLRCSGSEKTDWSWQVEVHLRVAVIQQQLLHSSAGEVVSFNCQYSV
ncbi:hypothetical protein HAX54_050694 [Datura stramonium]|uniref:Uncharacterized protein n=1 Tax=Datura stramonium TaxID=4076 RepID=A0ABS8SWR1_DATST|nr:hypothetical protein [Datura stramonium]